MVAHRLRGIGWCPCMYVATQLETKTISRSAHIWQFHLALGLLFLLTGCERPHDQGVAYTEGRPLRYKEDQFGNRIPDYSAAGYGGGSPIPHLPVKITLNPSGSEMDDTARIQNAVDAISALTPDKTGSRGALLLTKGSYFISGQIQINTSGVVLRGEGQFPSGTVLHATGKNRRSLIKISGLDPRQDTFNQIRGGKFLYESANTSIWDIVDQFVPSGANQVQVAPVAGLQAGDLVIVEQRMNESWVESLGMDAFPPRPDGKPCQPWDPVDFIFQFERTIEKMEGGRVTLNAPLVNPVASDFGITHLLKPRFPNRIQQVGVEQLRLISELEDSGNPYDEAHAWIGVEIDRAKNSWVRGVTSRLFGHSTVAMGQESLFVTVEDCAFLQPVAKEGYGRRHGFFNAGQLNLMQRCFTEDCTYPFFIAPQSHGPNVFLDCYAAGAQSWIGPWKWWSMGTLWDNTHGRRLMARNRGYDGQGWGWSGINTLFWNSSADEWISVQSPVNGWNWAIGCSGRRLGGPFQGLVGHFSHHGNPIGPRSLYMQQLEDRIGKQAAKGVFRDNQRSGSVIFQLRDTLAERQ